MNLPNKPKNFTVTETNFGTTIAKGLWVQAAQMIEYINASHPIGMLMYFYDGQPGLPELPDSRFWKYMDGSPVSNVNSPLNGITFPDLRNLFIRHPITGDVSLFNTAGADTINFTHNHTGVVGTEDDRNEVKTNYDFGGDNIHPIPYAHSHTLDNPSFDPSVLPVPTTLLYSTVPVSHQVQVYMRIL